MQQREFSGDDLFDALVKLRTQLERHGCQLLCKGARPDVFPSGMSRSMGGGRQAYIMRLGKPARMEDLVDIFDFAAAEQVDVVDAQKEFREKWINSLQAK